MSNLVRTLRSYSYQAGCPDYSTDDEQGQLIGELVGTMHAAADKIEALEALIAGLECDADWCGKSPRYNDGKCQICKAQAGEE